MDKLNNNELKESFSTFICENCGHKWKAKKFKLVDEKRIPVNIANCEKCFCVIRRFDYLKYYCKLCDRKWTDLKCKSSCKGCKRTIFRTRIVKSNIKLIYHVKAKQL